MATTSRVRPERKGYDVIIYQQHVDRIKKMQPTVDAGPPRPHPLSNKREMDQVYTHINILYGLCNVYRVWKSLHTLYICIYITIYIVSSITSIYLHIETRVPCN
jgi:hypothetical protein